MCIDNARVDASSCLHLWSQSPAALHDTLEVQPAALRNEREGEGGVAGHTVYCSACLVYKLFRVERNVIEQHMLSAFS